MYNRARRLHVIACARPHAGAPARTRARTRTPARKRISPPHQPPLFLPTSTAELTTRNLKQHLVGNHGVVVSSTHLGGRAAGECSSGSGGVRPDVANTRTGGESGGVWRARGRQGLEEWMVAAD